MCMRTLLSHLHLISKVVFLSSDGCRVLNSHNGVLITLRLLDGLQSTDTHLPQWTLPRSLCYSHAHAYRHRHRHRHTHTHTHTHTMTYQPSSTQCIHLEKKKKIEKSSLYIHTYTRCIQQQ